MARQQATAEERRALPAIMNQDSQQEAPRRPRTKLGKDVAESDLLRFMASMRLVISMDGMDAEDRTQLELSKRRIINAIVDGRLVIDQDGVPIYTPRDSEDKSQIRFPRPKGADFMQADLIKKNHDITKSFAIMAASTHESVARYAAMESTDLFVCQSIVGLYMGGE
jgi:hypothetical protein